MRKLVWLTNLQINKTENGHRCVDYYIIFINRIYYVHIMGKKFIKGFSVQLKNINWHNWFIKNWAMIK